MAASFEVKHLQKNRFTHPLSLSILHLEPFPRRDSNHHRNKISSLKPTGGERGVLRYELRCREGERCKVCSFVLSRRPPGPLAASRRWSFLWVNPGRGGGGTGSDSEENSWELLWMGLL
ncbi:hypothetical protein F2Q69_00061414 [Brassica cretica]|uniref:Uncharacterized protein n=1 Tax=Brassica cretica TaxID=69181 RepID=A0A8S9RMA2_BRACR|nr:hypothetical protein F2Q69_00061414 [Brassica cretica]